MPAFIARRIETPLDAWQGKGFLPRLPENLEELDLLLVMHAKPRTVQRDGIHSKDCAISIRLWRVMSGML
jgi:hypothetical protein